MKYPHYYLSHSIRKAGECDYWLHHMVDETHGSLLGATLRVIREGGLWYIHEVDWQSYQVPRLVAQGFKTRYQAAQRIQKILIARDVLRRRRTHE